MSDEQTDSNGNRFEEIGNLRVTYVRRERGEENDWAEEDVIRIQACKDGRPLGFGPECSQDTARQLIDTLTRFIAWRKVSP
jgi:hypothetical protein